MIELAPSTGGNFSSNFVKLFTDSELNKKLQPILEKINEDYSYWNKVKHSELPEGVDPSDIWQVIKMRRKITPNIVKFGEYTFHWNINNKLQEFLHFMDMNVGGSLESPYTIPNEDKSRYLISSIMEEAIASSQIEGAVTSRKRAKEMLRKKIKPKDKSEQMILNNYITIQKILEIKSQPLNKTNLLALHKLVSSNTMINLSEEGAFRIDNEIDVIDTATGEVVHHPPNKDELSGLLNDLFKFFNDDKSHIFIHPLIKACIIHFMVGFIHPFADGNGRTARALFYWYLLKKQYWLTEYLSISKIILRAKAQYARAFQYTEIDEHDLTYFILFNLRVMKLAFEELREYIKRKNEEKKQLSNFMIINGISYRQSIILEWYYKEPTLMLTVNETQSRLAISNSSARNDLLELNRKRYLDLIQINKQMKGYVKGKNFDELLLKVKKASNRRNIKEFSNQKSLFD